jgi:hypothetical protein
MIAAAMTPLFSTMSGFTPKKAGFHHVSVICPPAIFSP